MKKVEKERWILDNYLQKHNKRYGGKYAFLKQISEKEYPGPDFIVQNKSGRERGIEVTELLDFPSSQTGQQRYLTKEFEKLLSSKISEKDKKKYSLTIYPIQYPTKRKELVMHAEDIISAVNKLDLDAELEIKKRIKLNINGQQINISLNKFKSSRHCFAFFMYEVTGIQRNDRDNYIRGLIERIREKNKSFVKYKKMKDMQLVIYDNADFSIFISDYKQEIVPRVKSISSEKFKKVWLLTDQLLVKLS